MFDRERTKRREIGAKQWAHGRAHQGFGANWRMGSIACHASTHACKPTHTRKRARMRECPRRHTNEHPRAERTQVLNTMRATGCEEVGVLDSGVGVVQASHYLPARLPPFPWPWPSRSPTHTPHSSHPLPPYSHLPTLPSSRAVAAHPRKHSPPPRLCDTSPFNQHLTGEYHCRIPPDSGSDTSAVSEPHERWSRRTRALQPSPGRAQHRKVGRIHTAARLLGAAPAHSAPRKWHTSASVQKFSRFNNGLAM